MHHVTFKSANRLPAIDDECVPSFVGTTPEGHTIAAICLQPSYEDIQDIKEGKAICVSIIFEFPIPIVGVTLDHPKDF